MLSLVDVIIAILLFAAFQLGRRRGFAWQFAGVASLILGGMAARRFGPQLAASFGATEGLRSVLAWAAIYAGVASLVHILVARWRAWLQKKDLEELDSHLGGWVGAIKGAVILAVILLFSMTLSEGLTQLLLKSFSGRVLARLAPLVQDYLPPETSRRLAPYIPEIQPPPAPPPRGLAPTTSGQGDPKNAPPKPAPPQGSSRPTSSGAAGPTSSQPGPKSLATKPRPPAPRKEDGSEGDSEGFGEGFGEGGGEGPSAPAPSADPYDYKPLRPLDGAGSSPPR